tara:strand:- start:30636 stop:30857 length:222 start_codon:yes stop_codon:yes gene_type:complete
MNLSIVALLIVLYLAVGVLLATKGKLAFKIASAVAIMELKGNVPKRKLFWYRWLLTAGVVIVWPVMIFDQLRR